jgi:CubicO group peptidase (beta-lactamase class C family)
MKFRLFLAALAIGTLVVPGKGVAQDFPYQVFGRYLEPLAQQIGLPGLSAIIGRNNSIEWFRDYGFADVEERIPADINRTLYAVGGVTQAVTAVLVGVCADRFRFDIEQPIRSYVPDFPHNVSIRHVLAHASESRFRYDPANYVALTTVVERCLEMPYRKAVAVEVLDRGQPGMPLSVPGLDFNRPEGAAARELFDPAKVGIYQSSLTRVAKPYRIDRQRYSPSEYPSFGMDGATGLMATARDIAEFEFSLDRGQAVSRSTLEQMWNPALVLDGNGVRIPTPTGIGWFVQIVAGEKLVWTFGRIPDAGSALIVKMPRKNLTLILLSNSDGLTEGYNFDRGDVTTSPFVKVFLHLFA